MNYGILKLNSNESLTFTIQAYLVIDSIKTIKTFVSFDTNMQATDQSRYPLQRGCQLINCDSKSSKGSESLHLYSGVPLHEEVAKVSTFVKTSASAIKQKCSLLMQSQFRLLSRGLNHRSVMIDGQI
jgi:hypothetical protein